MPPMPHLVCRQSAQRAAAWGNQRSSLWANHATTTRLLRRKSYWKQPSSIHPCVWHSCFDWLRTLRFPGRLYFGSTDCTYRCPRIFCLRAPRRGSCLFWNMQRRCLNAHTSLCASRRIAMTELCWCVHSCSWALQLCHQDIRWSLVPPIVATSICCIPSSNKSSLSTEEPLHVSCQTMDWFFSCHF